MGFGMRRGYLLDTNQITKAVTSRSSSVAVRIREAVARGAIVGTCVPVLCEAEEVCSVHGQGNKLRAERRRMLRQMTIWLMAGDAAIEFGIVSRETRTEERALSHLDL